MLALALAVQGWGQALPSVPESRMLNGPQESRSPLRVYEDSVVKVVIPPDWKILKIPVRADDPAFPKAALRLQAHIPAPGEGLVLVKGGYTLVLATVSGHASGINGGRFIEVFRIPWLEDSTEAWSCSGYLRRDPQPVNRELIFINLTLAVWTPEGRKTCGIPEELDKRRGIKDRPWFAGYFTTGEGGWFIGPEGDACPQKSYTLTTSAEAPEELPDAEDPELHKIIRGTIGIVDSIQYKRCPPARLP